MKDDSSCCQDKSSYNDESSCCGESSKNEIRIDFLYLDLTVCERCQSAESNLDAAIRDVSAVLKAAGFSIHVNSVNITTRELANEYRFLSSPTIRVNGKDIALEVKESLCEDCGELCGDTVDCRVWSYQGEEYTEPPREMIVNAILKEIYGEHKSEHQDNLPAVEYVMPANLSHFFNLMEAGRDSV